MSKVNIFLADGFEEVEALTVVDLLRREGIQVDMISISGKREVEGSHGITVLADKLFEEAMEADAIVLPGGMPGTIHLKEHAGLASMIRAYVAADKLLAAICAAPTVYGEMGLLQGKRATCYPGMENGLLGAEKSSDMVVVDGNFVTSRGMGTAIEFGLVLVSILKNKETARELASKIVYTSAL